MALTVHWVLQGDFLPKVRTCLKSVTFAPAFGLTLDRLMKADDHL
jgi:hypothetical protein